MYKAKQGIENEMELANYCLLLLTYILCRILAFACLGKRVSGQAHFRVRQRQ